MKTKKEIEKAIEDSKKYFKEKFDGDFDAPLIKLSDIKKGIKSLAVANEICTLKWILGEGELNCYSKTKMKGGKDK